ncbi:glycosyltransferase family 39 protein [bacterium]|nr:glycosyltransferase family 39 protein [bacterium]
MKTLLTQKKYPFLISLLVLFHGVSNFVWHRLNTAPPSWDSAGHLSLSFGFIDRIGRLFQGEVSLLELLHVSNYYPPFVHFVGSLVYPILGRNYEHSIFLVGTLFFGLAIVYLYKIIKHIFGSAPLAFFTVLIFSFLPGVWEQSRHFHLDIPLVALLLVSFYHLLLSNSLKNTKHALIFFIFLAFAQLTKWYAFVYMLVPFFAEVFAKGHHQQDLLNTKRIKNLLVGVFVVSGIALPWYIANLDNISQSIGIFSTADAGDPTNVLSYESMFHYLKLATSHQVGIVSVILIVLGIYVANKKEESFAPYAQFLIALPYLVFTLIQNKDLRYILPLTPIFAFYIAYLLFHTKNVMARPIKLIVYILYLVFLFLFLSFNQFSRLPDNLKWVSGLMGGPYGFAWVVEPWSYAYNGDDWRNNEIVTKIEYLADESGLSVDHFKVLEISDNRFYSTASFDMYKLQNRFYNMDFVVPYLRFNPMTPTELNDYLSNVHFAIIPDNPGPPGLRNIAVLNQIVSYFKSDRNASFSVVEDYEMPDGNILTLYKRTNIPVNTGTVISEDSILVRVGNILWLDKEAYLEDFEVKLSRGSVESIVSSRDVFGNQLRISLEGVESFEITAPPDKQNIVQVQGWFFIDGKFVRNTNYKNIIKESGNEFVYMNLEITPRSLIPDEMVKPSLLAEYLGESISITLHDYSQESYVSYADKSWQWSSVLLTGQNSKVSIPVEGLMQLEVSNKNMVIKGFTQNWGFFRCYNGDAVCFYPQF